MQNQKIENMFNLALQATPQELEKSLELEEGFNEKERTWEVVIKYSGDAEELNHILRSRFSSYYSQIQVVNLKNEYVIMVLPESIVEQVANQPEIEFMEKPKSLFFAVDQGKSASCINPLQTGNTQDTSLTGKGVIVAVIDSGIDFAHPDFRNADGTTRILSLWDQTIPSGSVRDVTAVEEQENGEETEETQDLNYLKAPEGYYLGTEFGRNIINAALEQPMEPLRYTICPSRDISGHGTHVNDWKNKSR